MIELKGKKGRPSLGIYLESENQRGRWKESSCQNRNGKTLNFFWLGFVFDILDSSVNSLVSSKTTGAQVVEL